MPTARPTDGAHTSHPRRPIWVRLLPLCVVAAGLVAYWNSFSGVFLFDDRLHILGERRLSTLWPLWETLARKRPVVDYSLSLNHIFSADQPWGYHFVNLSIHILAALTLFGIVRRTLELHAVAPRYHGSAPWLALSVAMIWTVHPLQTQSVTYLVQRAESLMGLFYLLTLYCVLRGSRGRARPWWYGAAVVCCGLGMGSKAVMVTAPVVVFLFDRMFLSHSGMDILRKRWSLYAGLAGTWGVLWINGIARGVLNPSTRHANVGFGFKGITAIEYARTQSGVLLEYLKLSLWPHPLCLDYVWPVARRTGAYVLPGVVILALLFLTVRGLWRRSGLGFVGAWFFMVLAPTSSFIPIKDPLFEHRMYLSLAAVVVVMTLMVHEGVGRLAGRLSLERSTQTVIAGLLLTMATGALAFGTVHRNNDYHSEAGMWEDVRMKRPRSTRAAENLGTALLAEGRLSEAMTALEDAVRMNPRSADVRNGLGFALVAHGRLDEAIDSFREALRLQPTHAKARLNLGNALSDTGRLDEAIEQFRMAVRVHPRFLEARLNLGNALLQSGRTDEAIAAYRELLDLDPQHASAWGNLGTALLNQGRTGDAIEALQRAVQINRESHNAHNGLGIALASQGKFHEAIEAFQRALTLKPDLASAHYNLANCLTELDDWPSALEHYQTAARLEPGNAENQFGLGQALQHLGRAREAHEAYRRTLLINPNHSGARNALTRLPLGLGESPEE